MAKDRKQLLEAELARYMDVLRLDIKEKAPEIVMRTAEIQTILEGAVQQVRKLSYELSPEPVERAGLGVGLRHLTGRYRQLFTGELTADFPNSLTLPAAVSIAMFRIAEQALDNAVRHSGATKIRVVLRASQRRIALEIRDNGTGSDVARARRRPAGLGLLIMEGSAQEAGLTFEVASIAGRDTIVKAAFKPGPGPAARS